jgi:hypothetical protein
LSEQEANGRTRGGVLARVRRALDSRRHVSVHPSASFSATMRARLENHPGAFAARAEAIG